MRWIKLLSLLNEISTSLHCWVSYTIQNCLIFINESTIPQVINTIFIPEWLFLAARLVRDIILAWLVFWPGSMCMLVPLPADLDPKLTSEPLTGLGWATTDDDDCNFVSFGGDRRLYRRVKCSGWCYWCTLTTARLKSVLGYTHITLCVMYRMKLINWGDLNIA